MERIDDRTSEEQDTHTSLIGGLDRGMSGWGGATGGKSYSVWACRLTDAVAVLDWVERRGDITYIRATVGTFPTSGPGHTHTYVVNDGHPALRGD